MKGIGQTLTAFALASAMLLIQFALTDYVGFRSCREHVATLNLTNISSTCPAKAWCDKQHEVSKTTAGWMQLANLVYTLPGVVVLGIAGPFSDAYGRKPVLLLATATQLASVLTMLATVLWDLPLYWVVIGYSLAGITGNYVVVLSALFASASDLSLCAAHTDEPNDKQKLLDSDAELGAGQGGTKAGGESSARTTLIAFVEGGLYVGCAVGSTIFGQLGQFVRTGCSHLIYFAVGSSLYLIMLLIICAVPETLPPNMRTKWPGWSKANPVASLVVLTQTRTLGFLTLVFVIQCLVFFGYNSVAQLYTSSQFGWDDSKWSYFSLEQMLGSGLGMFFVVPLLQSGLNSLKIPARPQDFILLMLSMGFGVAQFSSYASVPANMGLAFYGIAASSLLAGVQPPLIRAVVSKQVSADKLGTVFGAISTVEAVAQLVWPILTLQTYKKTVDTFPSAFYILGAVGSAMSFLVVARKLLFVKLPVDSPHAQSINTTVDERAPLLAKN